MAGRREASTRRRTFFGTLSAQVFVLGALKLSQAVRCNAPPCFQHPALPGLAHLRLLVRQPHR